jgi:4-amino-4-deoxy-L-arabinose transferase-like glycosyltransferase
MFRDWIGPIAAMRLPIALLFGLSLALIYGLGLWAWDRPTGLIAALACLAMPRVFGHAHFASIETPLIFATLLTLYCFVRGLDSRRWTALTGLTMGLLLATKINGFFLIPPLLIWGQLYARRRYATNAFYMILLSPFVFVLLWPWLWHDTAQRILEYLQFHAEHQLTGLWYLGRKWNYNFPTPAEPAPWHYPTVMIAVTLPLSILFLTILGALSTATRFRSQARGMLFAIVGLFFWAVASTPLAPKYDGVRLFLPVFPMIALMAGAGAQVIFGALRTVGQYNPRVDLRGRALRMAVWGLGLIVLAEGGFAVARVHPYLLSYFNPLVGGLKGAATRKNSFEWIYWGEALNPSTIELLNDRLPPRARVALRAMHEKCFDHLQQWGQLREDLVFNEPPFDYHLIQMRKGMHSRDDLLLLNPRVNPPLPPQVNLVFEVEKQGVPMLRLYRTGPVFEAYRRSVLPPPEP